jgi:hypothetical protein
MKESRDPGTKTSGKATKMFELIKAALNLVAVFDRRTDCEGSVFCENASRG